DLLMLLIADERVVIVLNVQIVVTLSVHVDLLFALEVFEAEFVGVSSASIFGTAGKYARERVLAGGIVLRHVDAVVDGADDDRLVGIAFDEVDEDFIIDARPEISAPAFARPGLRNAEKRIVGGVWLAQAVPPELHADAPVLVHVGVFTRGHNDF